MTNTIYYIAKRRELHDAAPERCCLTLNDVQILQNHALRCCCIIENPVDVQISDLHNNVNVQMVDIRRKRQIITCIWRNVKKGIIKIDVPLRETRYNAVSTIYLPVPNTKLFKKSVFYYGAILWNALPAEIRNCDNIQDFKNKLYQIV